MAFDKDENLWEEDGHYNADGSEDEECSDEDDDVGEDKEEVKKEHGDSKASGKGGNDKWNPLGKYIDQLENP